MSRFAFTSIQKVEAMGVMASFAVFCVSSNAPVMIVVSSWVNSPPFPAFSQKIKQDDENKAKRNLQLQEIF